MWLKPRTLYMGFSSKRLVLRDFDQAAELEVVPVVALNGRRVVAVGDGALLARDVEIVRPFKDTGEVVADFEVAEGLLRHSFFRLVTSPQSVKPGIILHPLERNRGELAKADQSALLQLARLMGARAAAFHFGHELRASSDVSDLEFESLN